MAFYNNPPGSSRSCRDHTTGMLSMKVSDGLSVGFESSRGNTISFRQYTMEDLWSGKYLTSM